MKRLVEKAQIVPYTKEELKLLLHIIDGAYFEVQTKAFTQNKEDLFDYSGLISALEDELAGKKYYIDDFSTWAHRKGETFQDYTGLNFMQFLLVYYRKIFLFLTCVDKKKTLIYLHRGPLNMFVEWRLKIGK
jgi:hypothetical protein